MLTLLMTFALTAVQADAPPPRAHHAAVYDSANARVLVIGGSTRLEVDGQRSYQYFDDLWSFDGHRWLALASPGGPRAGQAVAYDSRRGRVLAYGGYCACREADNGRFDDLLELRGDKWQTVGRTGRPLTDAAMVYDRRRDRLVLFGGSDGLRQLSDETWEFDGTSWTRVSGPTPGRHREFAMAYDGHRNLTLLVTAPATAGAPADTWQYDGRQWTRLNVAGPAPSAIGAMAFDSTRGLVVMSAGGPAGSWAWDGARWRQLADGPLEKRGTLAAAYDAARDRLVVFGGRAGPPLRDLNDTWEWDGQAWTRVDDVSKALIAKRLRTAVRDNQERLTILERLFAEAGCSATLRRQPIPTSDVPNVICTLPGRDSRKILVTAHFDLLGPGLGIGDNWASSTLLPSLYQALAADTGRAHTVVFVGFSDEEKGLVGAKAYLQQMSAEERRSVVALINMDGIGMTPPRVWDTKSNAALLARADRVARSLAMSLPRLSLDGSGAMDSFVFHEAGIPVLSLHGLAPHTFGIPHTRSDDYSAVDPDVLYAAFRFVRALIKDINR